MLFSYTARKEHNIETKYYFFNVVDLKKEKYIFIYNVPLQNKKSHMGKISPWVYLVLDKKQL